MEIQRPLQRIELFRATQSRRGFLLSCCSSSLFRNDCRRSSELAPDSPQDEGRLLALAACHVSVTRVSNYLHGWNKVRAFALALASPLVYNPLAEVLVRLLHFC